MKIISYYSAGGKDLILKYIDDLEIDERIDGYNVLKCMEENRFDELKTKQWQGKIWEVYFYKHNRIFYVTVRNDKIFLLHSCRKQKNKTEKPILRSLLKEPKSLKPSLT